MATPVWVSTYPKLGTQTSSGATFLVKTDIGSTAYFVIVPQGSAAPSNAQVIAGTDADDNPVPTGFSASVSLLANTENSFGSVVLAAGTDYDAFIVAVDTLPQAVASLVRFSTIPIILAQSLVPRSYVGSFVTISLVNLVVATPKTYPGNFKMTAAAGDYYQISSLNETNVVIQILNNAAASDTISTRQVGVQVGDGTSPISSTFLFKISVAAASQPKSKPVGYNIPGMSSR
jgi:hypothetical protein